MKIIEFIKDLIAPKKCLSCQKEGYFLCPECLEELLISNEKCFVCKKKTWTFFIHKDCLDWRYFDGVIALTKYKWTFNQKLIKKWKYYSRKDVFSDYWKYLWELLWKIVEKEFWNYKKSDIILLSSPMQFWKKIFRWYNQADLITREIWIKTWLKSLPLVIKTKLTKSQTKFWAEWRWKNLDWAFRFNKKFDIKNKVIFIVDDVITTGSTVDKLAKILKQNWAKLVISVTIAS